MTKAQERARDKEKHRRKTFKRHVTALRRAAKKMQPVPDKQVKWLRIHRPSASMLLCIGSGPWKINRRFTVQANALKILGARDLSELSLKEINQAMPLEWQRKYLTACVALGKRFATKQGVGFDSLFELGTPKRNKQLSDLVMEAHYNAHGYYFLGARAGSCFNKPLPKVLGMFVRDYLMQNCVPVDRHVKKWLKDRDLPTKPDAILEVFEAAGLPAREYARAMFLNISSNPMHKPTRNQRRTREKESSRKTKQKTVKRN